MEDDMNKWMLAPCLALLLSAQSVAMIRQFCDRWYVNLGAGVDFPHINRNAYVTTGPGWPDDRYVRQSTQNTALVIGGLGYTWFNQSTSDSFWFPFISLGLSYTYVLESQIKGEIQQYSLTQFTNYNYQYRFQRQTVLALVKFDIYRFRVLMPYLIFGGGASFNRSTNFSEEARANVTPRLSPGFNSNTQVHNSAMGGVGLDLIIQDNLWGSFQYDYGFYGYTKTGYGKNTVNITGLNYDNAYLSNKLTSSTASFTLTYLFDT